MRRHAWNCDLSTKPGTDILTNCHIYIYKHIQTYRPIILCKFGTSNQRLTGLWSLERWCFLSGGPGMSSECSIGRSEILTAPGSASSFLSWCMYWFMSEDEDSGIRSRAVAAFHCGDFQWMHYMLRGNDNLDAVSRGNWWQENCPEHSGSIMSLNNVVYQFSQQLDGVHGISAIYDPQIIGTIVIHQWIGRGVPTTLSDRHGLNRPADRGQKAWHRAVFFVGGYVAARQSSRRFLRVAPPATETWARMVWCVGAWSCTLW